jgi:CheY-like chemotaxis protein
VGSPRTGRLHGVSVLFVDDHEDTREIVGAYLRYSGAHVAIASSGREALAYLAAATVDVLVIDYTMPGMTGIELLNQIRETIPGQDVQPTPAILYTAFKTCVTWRWPQASVPISESRSIRMRWWTR